MELLNLLLNPKILSVFGPIGALLIAGCWLLYKQYKHFRDKYEEMVEKMDALEEKRVEENKEMHKEYFKLSSEIEKTLDILISIIKNRRNGNTGT